MNRTTPTPLLAGLILAASCTPVVPELALPSDHPASPEAAEASYIPAPSVLASGESPADDEETPKRHDAGGHSHSAAGHHGHGHQGGDRQ